MKVLAVQAMKVTASRMKWAKREELVLSPPSQKPGLAPNCGDGTKALTDPDVSIPLTSNISTQKAGIIFSVPISLSPKGLLFQIH